MRIFSFIKNLFLFFLTVALVLGLLAIFVPWNQVLEDRLKEMAAANGLKGLEFSLGEISPTTFTLDNVKLGEGSPLTLSQLKIDFVPDDLIEGRLRQLNLDGLAFNLRQEKDAWQVEGIALPQSEGSEKFLLPVTVSELSVLPLETFTLANGSFKAGAAGWQTSMGFDGRLGLKEKDFSLTLKNLSGTFNKIELTSGPVIVKATLDEAKSKWQGSWRLDKLSIKKIEWPLPDFSGAGTLVAFADHAVISGKLQSADKTHGLSFAYQLGWDNSAPRLLISEAFLPWNGGVISTHNINVPLSGKQPIKLVLQVQRIPIGQLMQDLTGKKATATGVVSGTLPLTIMPDGSVRIEQGRLQADAPGIISLQPEAIPGDQQQVALVRDILKNLHYKLLSIELQNEKDNKMTVKLALEGQNPDIEAGRPVKLNVQLTGDVLDFIQNSVMTITDPKKLLKQGRDAKP